mmetsp:Transcript_17042/g.48701  ORF Transcript_17042/g.48701 Transcript_17042/m.48701 type:complete len:307 (+) Transcript_17042:922-1842(+)
MGQTRGWAMGRLEFRTGNNALPSEEPWDSHRLCKEWTWWRRPLTASPTWLALSFASSRKLVTTSAMAICCCSSCCRRCLNSLSSAPSAPMQLFICVPWATRASVTCSVSALSAASCCSALLACARAICSQRTSSRAAEAPPALGDAAWASRPMLPSCAIRGEGRACSVMVCSARTCTASKRALREMTACETNVVREDTAFCRAISSCCTRFRMAAAQAAFSGEAGASPALKPASEPMELLAFAGVMPASGETLGEAESVAAKPGARGLLAGSGLRNTSSREVSRTSCVMICLGSLWPLTSTILQPG